MKKLLFGFKLYYLIYLLLAFNAYINESKFMSYATLFLSAAGVLVFLFLAVQIKNYKNMCNIRLNVIFIGSYVLSSVCMFRYGFSNNGKECVWLLLTMVVLYASSYCYTADEMKREFRFLSAVMVAYSTIVNAVSISMVTWGREFGVSFHVDGVEGYKVIGFKWGRLWGLYDDPNHGATIAVAAVFLTMYLIQSAGKKWLKAVWMMTLAIQFAYIVLSDSRTGLVALGVGVCIWTAYLWYVRGRRQNIAAGKALGTGLLLGILLAAVLTGAAYECKQQYNTVDKKLEAAWQKKNKKPVKKPSGQLGRKKDLVQDASNGRIDIWKSGLEIAKTSPVYGVSFRNMTGYAQEKLPETYLVKNGEGVKYDSLHNSVMDILVSQGIVGIVILLLIIGNTVRLIRNKLPDIKEENRDVLLGCFSVIAAMGTGSMFLSIVFYLNAPQTYIFWLCFGYFVTILQKEGRTG
ncbi:MAG: O-antigen ligase family protein [Dorea sp.]|nr:O-antigen ligase family protein [Dorea sp.]